MNADTYRDAFLKFIAEGMSYAEARDQFGDKEWTASLLGELDDGVTHDMQSGELVTADERRLPTLLSLGARADFEKRNTRDFEAKALPLMLAGWTMEIANPTNSKHFWSQTPIFSLQWRAPSNRAGKLGRKYISTNQAFNAMTKADR